MISHYNHLKDTKNVKMYFYRFEFQERGTVYLHMLAWLKNTQQIRLNHITGDIPWANMKLAKTVLELQKSDKGCLEESLEKTHVDIVDETRFSSFFISLMLLLKI